MAKKPAEHEKLWELNSKEFFALCGVGGALACGITHTLITPLDVVKCRLQVDPKKYKSLVNAFRVSVHEEGVPVLTKGWAAACIGYSLQGCVRFATYEYFKYKFTDAVDAQTAYVYRTYLYLAAAAGAEIVADFFLSPFEATKVRMQTTPGYTSRVREAMPKMLASEGFGVFYRGLPPLWGRQIPYTMVKFASFEKTIEFLYEQVVPKPRAQCSQAEQLVVTYTAGYIAGVLCAVVSHPSDTIVSKLNKDPKATIGGIISEVGVLGIWSGLVPRILMIGTMAGAQWLIYDAFKVYARLPRPLPPAPPKVK